MAASGLIIRDLSISYRTAVGRLYVLRGINLSIASGSVVGLVGESGSGKSTLAYAIVRHLSGNAKVLSGSVQFAGEDLLHASPVRLQALRGGLIGMVYQDPGTALNPTLRLGEQLIEGLCQQQQLSKQQATEQAIELLHGVRLPDPRFIMRRFPHEVSGGEKQRVLIAMAFSCRPKLLIFDEPTTALDATTAAQILDLIQTLQQETQVAVLYITHDLGSVTRVAQRVNVIYAGQIVEEGEVEQVIHKPRHPYTRMLMASVPNPFAEGERRRLISFAGMAPNLQALPQACVFAERCPFVVAECRAGAVSLASGKDHPAACLRLDQIANESLPKTARSANTASAAKTTTPNVLLEAENIHVDYGRYSLFDQLRRLPASLVRAVADANLAIKEGTTVGLVGESGCGKSTLARALIGLSPFRGGIRFAGQTIQSADEIGPDYRQAVQIIFQHPDLSLNPRMRLDEIIGRPLRLYENLSGTALQQRVAELLDQVRLPAAYAKRYPHQLSGGEKQRIAIARAFAPRPRLVICDEITSGVDVSVQASILNLLADLQDEFGTAYLFISHDLNLVQHFADKIIVMYLGRIVETRQVTGRTLAPPYHPYTEALLSAVPVPEPSIEARSIRLQGPLPSPKDPPSGCCFNTRCPRKLGEICEKEMPPVVEFADQQAIACHIGSEALAAVPSIWQSAGRQLAE